jgi:hypothetical protein
LTNAILLPFSLAKVLSNGHSPQPPLMDAKTLMGTPIAPSSFTRQIPPPPSIQDGNNSKSNNDDHPQSNEEPNPPDEKPDFWNYLLVGLFISLYVASFASTYISSNILFYLLGGGGVSIPMMGMRIPLAEAISLMGTGILEGASLGDAYFEYKGTLPKEKKRLFSAGRFLSFIAQWTLYYMTLGSLLFSTADVTSLSGQDLESSSGEEAVLVLDPPTPLHGMFVFTLSGAWSFANNYVGLDALLVAISRLRRKNKADEDEDLDFFLALLAELENTLKDYEMGKEMDTLAMQLKQIHTRMDEMRVHSGLSDVFHQEISNVIAKIPDSKQAEKLKQKFKQLLLSKNPVEKELPKLKTPPNIPPNSFT